MSIDLVAACLWLDMSPARKLVLLTLCERADLRTGRCFPSREEMSLRSSLSTRSVTPHLRALERVDGPEKAYVRTGGRPTREGMTTTRWLNVERILREGEGRRRWLMDLQEQRRLQRKLLEDAGLDPGEDSSLAQLSLLDAGEVDDEPGEAASDWQEKFDAPAGEAASRPAGEAASQPTVIPPSDPRSLTPSEEPSWISPHSPPAAPMGFGDRVRQELQNVMTAQNYRTWFAGCRFDEVGGELLITPPSELTASWIESRMRTVVNRVAQVLELDGFRVRRD